MSVHAMSWAFNQRGLTASEKLVLLALCNYADDRNQCWPSQGRLALDTELSERTVWAAIAKLEKRGIISKERRSRKDGARSSDLISLHIAAVKSLTAKSASRSTPTRNLRQAYSQMSAKPNRNHCDAEPVIRTVSEKERGRARDEDAAPALLGEPGAAEFLTDLVKQLGQSKRPPLKRRVA